jgi:thiol-disulfide isomerase/thioredoxin
MRWSLLALGAALASGGCCNSEPVKPDPGAARSEQVRAPAAASSAGSPAASPGAARPAASAHAAAQPARKLCEAPPAGAGRAMPAGSLPHLEATGTSPLPDRLQVGGGRWAWVNLWAAWCGPCKEEIPRLKTWEARLAAQGTPVSFAYLSLDDDERQAKQFLDAQPAQGGLRATWWLPEDRGRAAWLEALKLRTSAQLPVQLLFDPQGHLACVVDGAVDETDFPQVKALVAAR